MASIVHNENGEELVAMRPDEYRRLCEERDSLRAWKIEARRFLEVAVEVPLPPGDRKLVRRLLKGGEPECGCCGADLRELIKRGHAIGSALSATGAEAVLVVKRDRD